MALYTRKISGLKKRKTYAMVSEERRGWGFPDSRDAMELSFKTGIITVGPSTFTIHPFAMKEVGLDPKMGECYVGVVKVPGSPIFYVYRRGTPGYGVHFGGNQKTGSVAHVIVPKTNHFKAKNVVSGNYGRRPDLDVLVLGTNWYGFEFLLESGNELNYSPHDGIYGVVLDGIMYVDVLSATKTGLIHAKAVGFHRGFHDGSLWMSYSNTNDEIANAGLSTVMFDKKNDVLFFRVPSRAHDNGFVNGVYDVKELSRKDTGLFMKVEPIEESLWVPKVEACVKSLAPLISEIRV